MERKDIFVEADTFLEDGLSSKKVLEKEKEGKVNTPKKIWTNSVLFIVLRNLLNWFNIILLAVAIFFLSYGVGFPGSDYGLSKYAFLIPVALNFLIGIYQEIKAKRTLDKVSIINTPDAKVLRDGKELSISSQKIVEGDLLVVERGEQIPVDGTIVEGNLSLNESLLTGEQKEQKKGVGEKVLGGTIIDEGKAKIVVTAVGKDTYSNTLKKELSRQQKPQSEMTNGVQRIVLVLSLLIIPFALITAFTAYRTYSALGQGLTNAVIQAMAVEVGTTVVGAIPTGLVLLTSTRCALSIISLYKKKTTIRELRAVEGLAFSSVVCMDKTGTLTTGRMRVKEVRYLKNGDPAHIQTRLKDVLNNVPDNSETITAMRKKFKGEKTSKVKEVIPFNSKIKYSGCVFEEEPSLFALGAPSFLLTDKEVLREVESLAKKGLRVLAFVQKDLSNGAVTPLCLIVLQDEIRPHTKDAIKDLLASDVVLKLISGDDPVTVSAIASDLGMMGSDRSIDMSKVQEDEDYVSLVREKVIFGRSTPEQKKKLIQALQKDGKKVTMVVDGLNDLLASKASDCSVCIAHEGGASAVSQVADVTILDGDFIHMPQIIKEGRKSVNNMERSATLFLMKSFLALGLSAFSPMFGHLPYSIEGLYLVTWFVTGLGGFMLGLEDNNEVIHGRFMKTVLSRSIPTSVFLLVVVLGVQMVVMAGGLPYAVVQTRYGEGLSSSILQQGYNLNSTLDFNQFQRLYGDLVISGEMTQELFYKNLVVLEEPLAILCCLIGAYAVLLRSTLPVNKFRLLALGVSLFLCLFFLFLMPNYFLGVDTVAKDVRSQPIWLFDRNTSSLYFVLTVGNAGWLYFLGTLLLSYPLVSFMTAFSDRYVFRTTDTFGRLFSMVDLKKDDSLKNSFKFLSK